MEPDTLQDAQHSSMVKKPEEAVELATRWQRFAAAFFDGVTSGVLAVAIGYFAGVVELSTEHPPSLREQLASAVIGFVVFIAMNWYLMLRYGQTIGKRVIGIQVVDMGDEVPTLKTQVFLRYLPSHALNPIPYIGNVYIIADALLVFGKSRRCIHDYLAGTKVIKVT